MIVLGLDPSQKTGWALYDPSANVSSMRCGVLKFEAYESEFERNASGLGRAFVKFLSAERDRGTGKIILPDFAVIEKAPRQPAGAYGGKEKPKTVKFMGEHLPAQHGDDDGGSGGGLQSTLSTNQMAAALCAILGAYQIPFVVMMPSEWRKRAYGFGTNKGWTRKDWKSHSRKMCSQMRIAATNDDMAEACWIAFAGAGTPEFKKLVHDRQARPAA